MSCALTQLAVSTGDTYQATTIANANF